MDYNKEDYMQRLVRLEGQVKFLNDVIADMKFEELIKITQRLEVLENNMDEINQYIRRNTMLLFNVREEEEENLEKLITDLFVKKLGITLTKGNIEDIKRITRNDQHPNSHRPIMIELTQDRIRKSIFAQRHQLHGSGIEIVEFLTKNRLKLFKKAKLLFGVRRVWTSGGKIVVIGSDHNKYYVSNNAELRAIPCQHRPGGR